MSHTPTPWIVDARYVGDTMRIIPESDKGKGWGWAKDNAEHRRTFAELIAEVRVDSNYGRTVEMRDANAYLIVQAVNTFDALLSAAKDALELIDAAEVLPPGYLKVLAALRAAIALAEGGRE